MVHNLETLITMSNSKMPSRIMKWGNWFIETIDLKSLLQRCIILHSYILLWGTVAEIWLYFAAKCANI